MASPLTLAERRKRARAVHALAEGAGWDAALRIAGCSITMLRRWMTVQCGTSSVERLTDEHLAEMDADLRGDPKPKSRRTRPCLAWGCKVRLPADGPYRLCKRCRRETMDGFGM